MVMVSFLLFANAHVVLADNIDDSITETEGEATEFDNQDDFYLTDASNSESEVNDTASTTDEYNDEVDLKMLLN